ncbi:hypothetical protein MRB53_037943 [Persea americana]|nr:hypothetical protein MRB53_037943 [Persea americana]
MLYLLIQHLLPQTLAVNIENAGGHTARSNLQEPLIHDKIKEQEAFTDLTSSLETMQDRFFKVHLGRWPTSIDWTGAVMGTYISSALTTIIKLSQSPFPITTTSSSSSPNTLDQRALTNLVDGSFAQLSAYYFGEDTLSLRTQAHDDMLWVVLGWLESIKLIDAYTTYHSSITGTETSTMNTTWHGRQFLPAFAHRARIFYDLVRAAWDRSLCAGGLTWNPHLAVYKNTVTNTQFIAASVSMYLRHPGDNISSPFIPIDTYSRSGPGDLKPFGPHEQRFLAIAIEAYDWLRQVNMTNAQGLYVDGYHVSEASRDGESEPGQCDQRNEMVYTYNQGVLLSGLRDLWEATGNTTYLLHGHELVANVVAVTGWSLKLNGTRNSRDTADHTSSGKMDHTSNGIPIDKFDKGNDNATDTDHTKPIWHGLGRAGILTELCDPSGTCSQDAQTFKGIFFHHLAAFCAPLPTKTALVPGLTFTASPDEALMHKRGCVEYRPWVRRNAEAALATRDRRGVMGMWWGVGVSGDDGNGEARGEGEGKEAGIGDEAVPLPAGAIDKRNEPLYRSTQKWLGEVDRVMDEADAGRDSNDRGRGRTVETQGGGLSVVRAAWELMLLGDL